MAGREKCFYVVDCSYYFRASYFALPKILSPSGLQVNAVYGFVSILLKLIRKRNPASLAIADDSHGHYARHNLLPTYKATKKPVPQDCNEQVPLLREALSAMLIPYICVDGCEADDIVATLTNQARKNGYTTYICSKDKDFQQLLAEDVVMLDIVSEKETTDRNFVESAGILPNQFPDLIGLIGDKVDNIPGVRGIGKMTATELLRKYRSVENLIDHLKDLKERTRAQIDDHRDQIALAKSLAILRSDVALELRFADLVFNAPAKMQVECVFRKLGLEKLLERMA